MGVGGRERETGEREREWEEEGEGGERGGSLLMADIPIVNHVSFSGL